MRAKIIAPALMFLAVGATLLPATAAEARHRHATHRVWVCENPRHAGNTGTIVGAIGGALVGNAVSSGGGKTGGTLIGAGLGGVAGHQIAKQHAKRNCHYEYR
jgi:uncharacterized protein YcfJ